MKYYVIEQRITLMVNQYRVFAADETGKKGELVAFAQQKRLAFREQFTIYTNEDKQQVLCSAKARQVMDFGARYDIRDENDQVIGVIGKAFKSSLLRSTWHVFKPGEEVKPAVITQERSGFLAGFRRVWDFIPILGDAPFPIKYHFDLVEPSTKAVRGHFNKTSLFFDHYLLGVDDDLVEDIDWRVFVGMGILLDAMQGR